MSDKVITMKTLFRPWNLRTKNYYNHEVNFFWFEKRGGGCEVVIVLTKKYKFDTNPVRKYKTSDSDSADYQKSNA